jgi:hypothetical protein
MKPKLTQNNLVLIKLDAENTTVKGLFIDTTYNPEMHITVTGEVYGLPSHLTYTGIANKGLPWNTPLELKMGDKVIVYYLSVANALKDEARCIIEGNDRYIFLSYEFIYCAYGDGWVRPLNGLCLIEPCEDPYLIAQKERMAKVGLELVPSGKSSNSNVSFGIVRYTGTPNKEYVDAGSTDRGVDVVPGDIVVLKKVTDIPLQYNLHAKIDSGKLYWRVQRRSILAKL